MVYSVSSPTVRRVTQTSPSISSGGRAIASPSQSNFSRSLFDISNTAKSFADTFIDSTSSFLNENLNPGWTGHDRASATSAAMASIGPGFASAANMFISKTVGAAAYHGLGIRDVLRVAGAGASIITGGLMAAYNTAESGDFFSRDNAKIAVQTLVGAGAGFASGGIGAFAGSLVAGWAFDQFFPPSDSLSELEQQHQEPTYIQESNIYKQAAQPVVVDLDDDGLEIVHLGESSTFNDIDGDGFKERTGWVAADDGILAIDLDGSGSVNHADEFVFTRHVNHASSDLEAIRLAFDTNNDGVLSDLDTNWSSFIIWQDLDQDGEHDVGEVTSLADRGITEINLNPVPVVGIGGGSIYSSDTEITGISTAVKADGSTLKLGDATFQYSVYGFKEDASVSGGVLLDAELGPDSIQLNDGINHTLTLADNGYRAVFGANGNDHIQAGTAKDILIDGGDGNDTIIGGIGSDWLIGGLGADVIEGGEGDDVIFMDAQDTSVSGGEGIDVAYAVGAVGINLDLTATSFETAYGSVGDDQFMSTGIGDVRMYGGDGNDVLAGGHGDDMISGGEGADQIVAGAGNDVLFIDSHDTLIDGGAGDDAVHVQDTNSVYLDLGQSNIEIAIGGEGGDLLVTSAEGGVMLTGGGGDDVLIGGAGNDVFSGGYGNDTISGGNGMSFDGNGYLKYSNLDNFEMSSFVLELDFKTSSANQGSPFSYASEYNSNELTLYNLSNLTIYIGGSHINTGLVLNDGERHRLTVDWDGTTGAISIYDNGDLAFSGALQAGYTIGSGGTMVLGQEQDTIGGGFVANEAFVGDLFNVNLVRNTSLSQMDAQTAEGTKLGGLGPLLDPNTVGGFDDTHYGASIRFSENGGSLVSDVTGDLSANMTEGLTRISGGDDSVIYSGLFRDYAITRHADGSLTVVDNRPEIFGDDGADHLSGIEKLIFADRTIYLNGIDNVPIADRWDWARAFKNEATSILATDLLANDGHFEGEQLFLRTVGNARHGEVGLDADGNVVFIPDQDFTGRARFDYVIADSNGDETTSTAYVTVRSARPTDEYFTSQWYLEDSGIIDVWEDYTGAGITVGIVDNGTQITHVDIDAQFTDPSLNYDYVDGDADPNPTYIGEGHGTALAGIVAAERNGEGSVGVAYGATLGALRGSIGISGSMSVADWDHFIRAQANFDVTTNSWGPGSGTAPFSTNYITGAGSSYREAAVEHVVSTGRAGLGTIIAKSAGNGSKHGIGPNYWNDVSSRQQIVVGSINQYHENSVFTERGSSILVSAAGQDVIAPNASDPYGQFGQSGPYIAYGGTSASAPIVAGVAALMLEANASLGYRDVQEILSLSATQVDDSNRGIAVARYPIGYLSSYHGVLLDSVEWNGWRFNAAKNWNGGGMHTSDIVGFGNVDAYAAVRLAETWQKTSTLSNETSVSAQNTTSVAIEDGGTIEQTLSIASAPDIQHVEVEVDISHTHIGDLIVTLISPDGTESILLNRAGKSVTITGAEKGNLSADEVEKLSVIGISEQSVFGVSQDHLHYRFSSSEFWGEAGIGDWTLRVTDAEGQDTGTLNSWKLSLFGDAATADDTYFYTDEFTQFDSRDDADRRTLVDNEGIDTINASAVAQDLLIDLNQEATSWIADNTVTIETGTVIENAFGGDGDDWINGNAASNFILGGRGDDIVNGGDNGDTLDGGLGYDWVEFTGSDGAVYVDLHSGESYGGHADGDVLSNFEAITGSSFDDTLVGSSYDNEIFGGVGDDKLVGRSGNDTLTGAEGNDILIGDESESSLRFDGTGYAIFETPEFFGGNAITMEVEFQALNPSLALTPISYASTSSNDFTFYNLNNLAVYVRGVPISTGLNLADGQRHRLTVTWQSHDGALQVYDNGVLAYSANVAQGQTLSGDGYLVLGQEQNLIGGGFTPGFAFDGDLFGVRAWNKVLTTSDIAAGPDAYNASEGLVLNVGLDEGAGIEIRDKVTGVSADIEGGATWSNAQTTDFGDDTLYGGSGDDVLIGGAGDDVAIFDGIAADYEITEQNGYWTVSDVIGDGGIDTLSGVETLRFEDRDVALQTGKSGPSISSSRIVIPSEFGNVFGQIESTGSGEVLHGIVEQPSSGTVTIAYDGTFEYQADSGFIGQDSFKVRAIDADGYTTFETIQISVEGNYGISAITQANHTAGAHTTNEIWTEPSMAALSDGTYIVTWSVRTAGTSYEVYGRRFSADGQALGSEFHINESTWSVQASAAVAELSDGGFIVTWTSYTGATDNYQVMGRRYDSNGVATTSEFTVNTISAGAQFESDVIGLSNGNFLALWVSDGVDGSSHGIAGQLYASDGTVIGAEFVANDVAAGSQRRPRVTELTNGEFVVSWYSNGDGVKARRFSSSSVAIGTDIQLNADTPGSEAWSTVVGLEGGGFAAIWQDPDGNPSPGEGFDIALRMFNDSGVPTTGEIRVNDTSYVGRQLAPSAAALRGGGFVVVWSDEERMGVYAQKYTSMGVKDGAEELIQSFGFVENWRVEVTGLAHGGYAVSWQASTAVDGETQIFTRSYYERLQVIDGHEGADIIVGTAYNDTISGFDGADRLQGGDGDDTISGGLGHDLIVGGQGNDTIDGGDGRDLVIFEKDYSAYTIDRETDGSITIVDTLDGWTDSVINAEGLEFQDIVFGIGQTGFLPGLSGAPSITMTEDANRIVTEAELLSTAIDIEGDVMSVSNVSILRGDGLVADNFDGTWTIFPSQDFDEEFILSYEISDIDGTTNAIAEVNVTPVNDAPTASGPLSFTTAEDVSLMLSEGQLLTLASDVDGDVLRVEQITSTSGGGTFTRRSAGWRYVPGTDRSIAGIVDPNEVLSEEQVRASLYQMGDRVVAKLQSQITALQNAASIFERADAAGSHSSFFITESISDYYERLATRYADRDFDAEINDLNKQILELQNFQATADVVELAYALSLLSNVHDANGGQRIVLDPEFGEFIQESAGWMFTPDPDFNGPVTFDFVVSDGTATTTSNGSIDVTPVADRLKWLGDVELQGVEDTPLTITSAELLSNAYHGDGTPVSLADVRIYGDGGTLTDNGDGTWTFNPTADFYGTSTIVFDAIAGSGRVFGRALVNVVNVNDAPIASNDIIEADEGVTVVTSARILFRNDTDVDQNKHELTVQSVSNAVGGEVSLTQGGDVAFTPNFGFAGVGSYDYTVVDEGGLTSTATVTVNVRDIPSFTITEDTYHYFNYDSFLMPWMASLQGDVTVEYAQNGLNENIDLSGNYTANASDIRVGADQDFNGLGYSTIRIFDSFGNEYITKAVFNVLPVNDSPVIIDQLFPLTADGSLPITISEADLITTANDIDDSHASLTVADITVTSGVVTNNGDGTWTFTPPGDAEVFGQDIFLTYEIRDVAGASITADLPIQIVTPNSLIPSTQAGSWLTLYSEPFEYYLQRPNPGATSIYEDRLNAIAANNDPQAPADPAAHIMPNSNSETYVLTWSNKVGSNSGVHAQVFNFNGVPLGDAFEVAPLSYTPGVSRDPAVLPLVDGTLLFAWQDSDGAIEGSAFLQSSGIVIKHMDANGNELGTATFVNDARNGDQTQPQLSMLSNGDVEVRWKDDDGNDYVNTFDPSTGLLDSTDVLAPSEVGHANVDVGYRHVWASDGSGLERIDIYARPVDAQDVPTGPEMIVYSSDRSLTQSTGFFLKKMDLDDGSAIVFWKDINEQSGKYFFRSQRVSSTGHALGDPVRISPEHDNSVFGSSFEIVQSSSTEVTAIWYAPNRTERTFSVGPIVNNYPTVADDYLTAVEDTAVTFLATEFISNDSDLEGGALTIVRVFDSIGGTATLDISGNVEFTPAPDFFGQATFKVEIADPSGGSRVSIATVDIAAVDDPLAVTGVLDLGSIDEEGRLAILGPNSTSDVLNGNILDVDGDALTYSVTSVEGGRLNGVWFEADLNFNGVATINYTVSDGINTPIEATATVTINPVNDAPSSGATVDLGTIQRSDVVILTAATLLQNASDIDGDTLSVANVTVDIGAVVDNGDGTWSYTPPLDHEGTATFSFDVADAEFSDAGTATLNVSTLNYAPTVSQQVDLGTINEDNPLTITEAELLASATDLDGDNLTVSNVTPSGGTIVDNGNGTWSYTPDLNFHGNITFTYDVSDGIAPAVQATAAVVVNPVNDAPTAVTDTLTMTEGSWNYFSAADLLVNDTDIEAGSLSVASISRPDGIGPIDWSGSYFSQQITNGRIGWTPDLLSFYFVPDQDFFGSSGIYYVARDAQLNESDPVWVEFNVLNTPDAPTVSGPVDLGVMAEDASRVVTEAELLAHATDVDGDVLSVSNVSANNGSVADNVDGTWTYMPATGYSGAVTFSFNVSDGITSPVSATATLLVDSVNNLPVPMSDLASASEDGLAVVIDVLANDTDADNDTLTVTSATIQGGAEGAVSVNPDNTVSFDPGAGYQNLKAGETQSVTINYTVSDGTASQVGNITVTVTGTNDGPVAAVDTVLAVEDTVMTILAADLLVNDTDVDGDTLTISSVGAASAGSVALDVNGDVVFTPPLNFNGQATFDYTVSDGNGGLSTSTVTIDISGVNDAPVVSGPVDLGSLVEDTSRVVTAAQLLANASDADTDPMSVSGVSADSGTVLDNGDGTWTYTPIADFNGNVTFTFDVSDGIAAPVAGTASLNVTPVNDAPSITGPVNLGAVVEDGSVIITSAELLGNAVDPEADLLSVLNVTADSGSVVDNGNGTWTYTTATDFNGTVSFSYDVSDSGASPVAASASLIVSAVNDSPIVSGTVDLGVAVEDSTIIVMKTALLSSTSDIDGDVLSVLNLSANNGSVVDNGDGTWTYTPPTDFNGSVSFLYDVSDGTALPLAASATLSITATNDLPVPMSDLASASEDGLAVVIDVLANDTDADNDTLTVTSATIQGGAEGAVSVNPDNTVSFDPGAGYQNLKAGETQSVTINYTVSDGTASQVGNITVTVTGTNDGPVAAVDTVLAVEDTVMTILAADLLVNDTDVDGDTLTISSVGAASAGSVALDVNGDVVFTPPLNFNGQATFDYTVSDGNGGLSTSTVTIDISGVNDAPVVSGPVDLGSLVEDTSRVVTAAQLLANASDADTDPMSVSGVSADSGTVLDNGDGTWTYTPIADFNGNVTFTFDVSDGIAAPVAGTASLNVTPVNDAPVAGDDRISLASPVPVVIAASDVLANDNDIDGDSLILHSVQNPVNGSVLIDVNGDILFTPTSGFQGQGSFVIIVDDGNGGTDASVVTVDVTSSSLVPDFTAGLETQLNDLASSRSTNLEYSEPSVAARSDGGYVTAWSHKMTDGTDHELFVRISDSSGAPVGPSIRVNQSTWSVQGFGVVDTFADDSFVVSWGSWTGSTNRWEIFMRRYDAVGNPLGAETVVNTNHGNDQYKPEVQTLSDGSFFIFWNSNGQDSSSAGVYGQRFDSTGTPVGGEFLVNTHTFNYQGRPRSVELANGNFVVAWESYGQDGSQYGAYAQVLASDGSVVGNEFRLNSGTTNNQNRLFVSALEDGGFAAVYRDGDAAPAPGAGYDVTLRLFNADGSARTDEIRVNSLATVGDQLNPSIATLSDGNLIVVWASGNGAATQALYAQRFSSSGEQIGTQVTVDTFTWSDTWYPNVTALENGGFAVAWQASASSTSDPTNIYTRAYTLAEFTSAGTNASEYIYGTEYDDVTSGAGGADTLIGLEGNDRLSGGVGDDVLRGGAGDDTFEFASGDGSDVIQNQGHGTDSDRIEFGSGIAQDQLWFSQDGDDLDISIIGTNDAIKVEDWYAVGENKVAEIEVQSGQVLVAANVQNLVNAMSTLTPPALGETTLSQTLQDELNTVIAANWT